VSVTVRIPLALARLTDGQKEVQVEASNIREMVDTLETTFPGIKDRLCDESGELRGLLNFYVNEKDIRFLQHSETGLEDGDHISIVPLIAGG
jgi:molybdopterin synthase sulfur carrier subunit